MRQIVMFNRMTADGFFAAADGNLNWAVPDETLDKEAASSTPGSGTMLFGRRTYDMFEAFWPHALDNSSTAPDPHEAGRRSREIGAIAAWINAATKIVFSKTRREVTWQNSQLFHELDPHTIEALKEQPGKDMMIFGSGTIVLQLSRHQLIDEYRFVVNPVLLGNGRPLLDGPLTTLRLDLVEAKAYPSGNVMLRYTPHRT